jgi:hypothetical protein
MRCFLIVFFIFACLSVRAQSRVIGGREIDIRKAPWMANIRVVNTAGVKLFNRSGVVISENLVITASHDWPVHKYDHLEVHVGGDRESEGKHCMVHRFIHHPDFDITILELSESLDFDDNIQPIDYSACADESLYAPGTDAVIYGWGTDRLESSASLKLRSADVRIITKEEANMIYGASIVPDNTIVSRGETIQMAGKGDSGGALVVSCGMQNPVLVGITTLADTRSESENSGLTVYAKVNPIIEWIDSCKCELIGTDTVPSTGTSFKIANMPPEANSVEWTYSGLTEITSTGSSIDLIPSETGEELTGYICAAITTDSGILTLRKKLLIMPRIDVDINITYNELTSKYEMRAKIENAETANNKCPVQVPESIDDMRALDFIWIYNKDISMGKKVIFDMNPNASKIHTLGVGKHDCDHTLQLEKTFVIQRNHHEFITVHNEPGIITLESISLPTYLVTEELQVTHTRNAVKNSISVNTSKVTIENPHTIGMVDKPANYEVSIYSRIGSLLYSSNFNEANDSLQINISGFPPDVYILYICNLDTSESTSRMLIINSI